LVPAFNSPIYEDIRYNSVRSTCWTQYFSATHRSQLNLYTQTISAVRMQDKPALAISIHMGQWHPSVISLVLRSGVKEMQTFICNELQVLWNWDK